MITRRNDGVTTYQFAPLNLNVEQRQMLEQAIASFSYLIIWGETVTWQEFGHMIANHCDHPKANQILALIEIIGSDR